MVCREATPYAKFLDSEHNIQVVERPGLFELLKDAQEVDDDAVKHFFIRPSCARNAENRIFKTALQLKKSYLLVLPLSISAKTFLAKVYISAIRKLFARDYLRRMERGMRPLRDKELRDMLRTMRGRKIAARNKALILLGIHTGYRITEMLSLRVGDVWDGARMRSCVTVRKSAMKGGREERSVPLHPNASRAIAHWLRKAGWDDTLHLDVPLFGAQGRGRPISRQLAARILTTAAQKAGISTERIGTHSLRKTFAGKAWQAVGGDMAKMARLLGHKNWSNTLRYIEFLDGSVDAAIRGISYAV